MVYCDVKMQYLWQNDNRYYCKTKHFPTYLLCILWHHVINTPEAIKLSKLYT